MAEGWSLGLGAFEIYFSTNSPNGGLSAGVGVLRYLVNIGHPRNKGPDVSGGILHLSLFCCLGHRDDAAVGGVESGRGGKGGGVRVRVI